MGVQEVLFVSLVAGADARGRRDGGTSVLFLLVLAVAPVLWLINRRFHRVLSRVLRAMRESFSRVTATLAESVLGIRITQGFVRQEENARMFAELVGDHSNYNRAVMRTHGLFVPLLDLTNQSFIAALLFVGSYRVLAPGCETSLGDLIGFLFMAGQFFGPISTLGNQYSQAMTTMAGGSALSPLGHAAGVEHRRRRDLPLHRGTRRTAAGDLRLRDKRAARHQLRRRAGADDALVGQTGSGKNRSST